MPKNMEPDSRRDLGLATGSLERPGLLGGLPWAAVLALQEEIARLPAGNE
jgi:hypothetical protein